MEYKYSGCDLCMMSGKCDVFSADSCTCDRLLEKRIEKDRQEYYSAWFAYLRENGDYSYDLLS